MNTNVNKSPNDNNDYKTFTLNNKLNVFISSDTNIKSSSVGMLVKIGFYNDTISGIAHFLEHMLFNGTKKYPNESEFMSLINKNNGHTNAYTCETHTFYYYEIFGDKLDMSLDMFSRFFYEPLLNKKSISREIEAVDAEHKKNINNDKWRKSHILSHACESSHPCKNFGCGTRETLNIPDINKHVRKFYETYYSSDLMTLFIVSNKTINELEILVNKYFNKIKLNVNKKNRELKLKNMLIPNKLIKLIPIEDTDELILYYELPNYRTNPNMNPEAFVSFILNDMSENTLYDTLIKQQYISSMNCYITDNIYDKIIYSININLLPEGYNNLDYIIQMVHDYINILKYSDLSKLYNDFIKLLDYNFKYQESINAIDRILNYSYIVSNLSIPLNDILTVQYNYEQYNVIQNEIYNMLNLMNMNNVVIVCMSKQIENMNDTFMKDKYYNAEFIIEDYIKPKTINHNGFLSLPSLNKYLSFGENIINNNMNEYEEIKNNIYYYATNQFKTPDGIIYMRLELPESIKNIYNNTNSILYFDSLMYEINSELSMCFNANYFISINYSIGYLFIEIYGNYEKLNTVCEFIINSILNTTVSEKYFNTCKYLMIQYDQNEIYSEPYVYISEEFNKYIFSKYYSSKERIKIMDTITLQSVNDITKKIFNHVKLKAIIGGNITYEQAIKICDILELFKSNNKNEIKLCYKKIKKKYKRIDKIHEHNKEINYAFSSNYIIIQDDCCLNKDYEMINILNKIINVDYFNKLRTKEQFGYIVSSDINKFFDNVYFTFMIQSSSKTPDEMIKRTNKFIKNYQIENKITDKILHEIVETIIDDIDTPFLNLEEMIKFIFNTEILTNYLDKSYMKMNYSNEIKKIIKSITRDDILNFYSNKILNGSSVVITLSPIGLKN